MNEKEKGVRLANVTNAIAKNAHAIAITMIEFLLIFMIDKEIVNQTQRFKNIDRCLYFAEKLHNQPPIPTEDGNKRITAYCKPVRK